MIVEFFGLSRTGKTIMRKNLDKNSYLTVKPNDVSKIKKILFFFRYFILNPINTFYLFYVLNSNHISKNFKVLLMRNSYLVSVLSKNERIKNNKKILFVEEFSLQSLFMIFQKKSNILDISNVIDKLPKNDKLLVFEFEGRKDVYNKLSKEFDKSNISPGGHIFPGGHISIKYAVKWMENMEFNYDLIKNLILVDYEEANSLNKIIKENYDKNKEIPRLYSIKL